MDYSIYSNIVKENAKYTPNLAKPFAPSQAYICGTLCKSLTLNPCMYAYRETGWENKGMPHHGINKSIKGRFGLNGLKERKLI